MKSVLIPALLSACFAGYGPMPSHAESMVVQWHRVYSGVGDKGGGGPRAVAVDNVGNVIVTGQSVGLGGNADFYTAKYAAADGALLWERRYDGPAIRWNNDLPTAIAVDTAGNAIVTGASDQFLTSSTSHDYYTAKYAAADGGLIWEKRYNGPASSSDWPYGLAVDNAGNVFVTGQSNGEYYTAKYAAANGALLWERGDTGWSASGLALDSTGNAIVAGSSIAGETVDFYTVKYAGANGALLWARGGSNGGREASDVTVDNEGNAIVTGYSDGWEYYTAKYAAGNGALLWERRYSGPGAPSYAHDVEVDNLGNAIVTGLSETGLPGKYYFCTLKYAAADGTLLWESRHDGARRFADDPRSLAVDSEGNVLFTVMSDAASGANEIYTAKYAAANGSLLWELRVPSNSSGAPQSHIALTPDGGVVVAGVVAGAGPSAWDFYTVKYIPVDLDLDDDGLLDSWEVAHFGSTEAHSALDDTDEDGAVELLELAFDTDPLSPSLVPAASAVIEGDYLTTTITKQPCVRYLVETGAGLESGFSAGSTTVLTDTATTLKVRDNIPVGTQPARFLRVRVTAAP